MAMRVSRCDTLKLLSQWSVTKDCGTVLSESELLNKTRDGQRAREDADEDGSMAWSVERSKLERRRRQVKYVFVASENAPLRTSDPICPVGSCVE